MSKFLSLRSKSVKIDYYLFVTFGSNPYVKHSVFYVIVIFSVSHKSITRDCRDCNSNVYVTWCSVEPWQTHHIRIVDGSVLFIGTTRQLHNRIRTFFNAELIFEFYAPVT